MTGCERFGDRLSALVDGELSPPSRAELHAHLTGCDDCSGALAALRRLDDALSALPQPQASPQFEARLWARIARTEAERRSRWTRLLRRIPFEWGVAAAALAGVAILLSPGQQAALPENDWAILADSEHFELLVSEDLELIEALEVLEAWDASEGI